MHTAPEPPLRYSIILRHHMRSTYLLRSHCILRTPSRPSFRMVYVNQETCTSPNGAHGLCG